jgi:uncharacterized tellurite resistance protein B-like protein
MFDALSRIFSKPDVTEQSLEPPLAVAALLVHLAGVDGPIETGEHAVIKGALQDHYGIGDDEVEKLIAEGTRRDAESVDFYRFTSALSSLPESEKIAIIRMMWQVVFADDKNHELEDNMVWRIAELIHVSARDRTTLRKQVARSS